jgi:uncharacterized protein
MLEHINRVNLLYDIYAPLLTEHQQQILQLYFSDNYSMGEIALEYGISRQAVHDLIQRALSSLEKLEQKLGLYKLYDEQLNLLDEAELLLEEDELSKKNIERLKGIIKALRSSSEQ